MININSIHKYFIYSIFISGFLIYFTKNSIISYSPIIIFMLLIFFFELCLRKKLDSSNLGAVLVWIPFVLLASFYYILNPYEGKYITANFLIILALPLISLTIIRMKNSYTIIDYANFNYKIFFYFLFFEFLICVGQISTYLFGFGLPVVNEYKELFIVPGSFNNPNDLASIILLISFSLICFENKIEFKKRAIIWCLIFLLVFISGSRSATAFVLFLFLFFRGFSSRQIVSYILASSTIIIIYKSFRLTFNNEVFSYFFDRLDSLFIIITEGSSEDGSATLRLDSYIHFLKNILDLGLGSGEIGNYHQYARNANFSSELIFENPHSLIVEVGYWLGMLGLIFLALPVIYLLKSSDKKIVLIFIFLVSSSISSSVLSSFMYFYMIIFCFFISLDSNKKRNVLKE